MDNIKVAVRVRPFTEREKERKAKCIISMKGNATTIRNPDTGETKTFTFDFSYWSHCPSDPHFAGQSTVFEDLGTSVLQNAWNGYNVSLFAYGQTGFLICIYQAWLVQQRLEFHTAVRLNQILLSAVARH